MSRTAITTKPRRVSLVIPTWNAGARFRAVLDSLAAQDIEGGFELVVIDSGSRDDTPLLAADYGAYVERIPNAQFNHGATRNLGISRTRGELVALLTQDARPLDAGYLRAIAGAFDRPEVDGVVARQFPLDDCDPILKERLRQWSAAKSAREWRALVPGDANASAELFARLPPMERYQRCIFDNVASAVRKSSWQKVPFPARTFGEDVAWARAMLLAGGTIAYEPQAQVEHSHRISIRREFQRLYCDHRNLNELFELCNVPSWGHVLRGWRWGRRHYAELLARLELPRRERWGWRLYSIPYALAEGTAQFLGARSLWKTRESRLWAALDQRLRRGI